MQRHRTRTKILQRHSELVRAAKEERASAKREQMRLPPAACLNVGMASKERRQFTCRSRKSRDSLIRII